MSVTSAKMIINFNQVKFPQLSAQFEPLYLRDGRLLFNSTTGRQVIMATPPIWARELINLCNGKLESPQIIMEMNKKFSAKIESEVTSFLKKLHRLRIISENLETALSEEYDANLIARFSTEISYFQGYETPELSALDYFRRLRVSRVVIIGAGGNGSLAAMMLAAAGIGHIHLVDGDIVEDHNLVRQIFYSTSDALAGRYKVEVLAERIKELTNYTSVTTSNRYISNVSDVITEVRGSSFVLLCADMPRFIINQWVDEACWELFIPNLNAFSGMVGPLTIPGQTPCFECLANHFRSTFGATHDDIVHALQKRRERPYPSIVTGPALVASKQVYEVIGFITGAYTPKTLKGMLRTREGNEWLDEIADHERCSKCQSALHKM